MLFYARLSITQRPAAPLQMRNIPIKGNFSLLSERERQSRKCCFSFSSLNQKATGRNAGMSLQDGTTYWSHDLLAGLHTRSVGVAESQLASSSNLLALPTLRPHSFTALTPRNSATIRSGWRQGHQRHPQVAGSCSPVCLTGQVFLRDPHLSGFNVRKPSVRRSQDLEGSPWVKKRSLRDKRNQRRGN